MSGVRVAGNEQKKKKNQCDRGVSSWKSTHNLMRGMQKCYTNIFGLLHRSIVYKYYNIM